MTNAQFLNLLKLSSVFIVFSIGDCRNSHSQDFEKQTSKIEAIHRSVPMVRSELVVRPDNALDPDDMCFLPSRDGDGWIIASDKKADLVFLLDSSGFELDRVSIPKPGNIDARPSVRLFGKEMPLIVVNQRDPNPQLRAFTIEERDGAPKLKLIPSDMSTGQNYGCCISLGKEGQLFVFTTTEGGEIQQYEIIAKDQMLICTRLRAWSSPICEGAVSDDQSGFVYLTEETVGIRKVAIDHNQPVRSDFILRVGQHGVMGDLEGITILPTGSETGYIIASDQGRSQFIVLDRKVPHRYIGSFQVEGANHTDGVDIANYPFGNRFERGLFACHTDSDAEIRSMVLVKLSEILTAIETIDEQGK
jgi:3-phytase